MLKIYITVTYIRVDANDFKMHVGRRSATEFAVAEAEVDEKPYRAVASAVDPEDICYVQDGAVGCRQEVPHGVLIVKETHEEAIREAAIDTAVGRLIKVLARVRSQDAIELAIQFVPNRRPRGMDPMELPMWALSDAHLGSTVRHEPGAFGVQFEYVSRDVDAGFKTEKEDD